MKTELNFCTRDRSGTSVLVFKSPRITVSLGAWIAVNIDDHLHMTFDNGTFDWPSPTGSSPFTSDPDALLNEVLCTAADLVTPEMFITIVSGMRGEYARGLVHGFHNAKAEIREALGIYDRISSDQ